MVESGVRDHRRRFRARDASCSALPRAVFCWMVVQHARGLDRARRRWPPSLPLVLCALQAHQAAADCSRSNFPEAIDLIARALRAGHALTTGLGMVADEIPAPVGQEFRRLYDEQNFGMSLPEAMRAMARRVPVLDARFFVTAVLTQREAGGNLSEVLDNLASVMRERFKMKRQVRVASAHGRISAWVLSCMPPALGGDSVHPVAELHEGALGGSVGRATVAGCRHAAADRNLHHLAPGAHRVLTWNLAILLPIVIVVRGRGRCRRRRGVAADRSAVVAAAVCRRWR